MGLQTSFTPFLEPLAVFFLSVAAEDAGLTASKVERNISLQIQVIFGMQPDTTGGFLWHPCKLRAYPSGAQQ